MDTQDEQALAARIGLEALAFLLASSPDDLQQRLDDPQGHQLSEIQEEVFLQLLTADAQFASWNPGRDYADTWAQGLSSRQADDTPMTWGNQVRVVSGGTINEVDSTLDELSQNLVQLAVDLYPGLIVKEPDDPFGFSHLFGRGLFTSPNNARFQELVLEDNDLKNLFTTHDESSGHGGSVMRSTGAGGSIQLWTFAETLIKSAWLRACMRTLTPSIDLLVETMLAGLSTIREAINEREASAEVRVGITGVLFPECIDEVDLGWGRLRRADGRDQPYIRATGTEGQLTTTNEQGEPTVINYHGDLVLEITVPYSIEIRELDLGARPWPESLLASARAAELAVENLRLGLLLALPDQRAIVHLSWQTSLEPFSQFRQMGWSDPKQAIGLMPMQLTEEQVDGWKGWATKIGQHRSPSVAVAVRRMLASVAERRTMEDVLVDAVIVWENLFGAKTETTLRVCSSLAWLLGHSSDDRKARLSRYKKIYAFRSAVVHGAAAVDQQQLQTYALEAVNISVEALRVIFETKPELLQIKSSEERGIELMHNG